MKAVLFERKNGQMEMVAVADVMHYSTAVRMLEHYMFGYGHAGFKVNHETYTNRNSIHEVLRTCGITKMLSNAASDMEHSVVAATTVVARAYKNGPCTEYCIMTVDISSGFGTNVMRAVKKLTE